ncbi:hypothetical protein Q3G72_015935 [Acer saccharum]|nr:hypothetical protein Q3G72_015935 [Acer saccharum]
MQITKPHAALLASPGMGHLIPVLELGNRLVNHHNLHVTVFVVAAADITAEKISQLLDSSPNDHLNVMLLPSVDISGIVDPDTNMVTKIVVTMHESLPALRSAISGMKIRPTALIVDLFGTGAMPIADEFEMLKYVFIASNAWFLATTIYAPFVDKKVLDDEHVDQKKPLKIPGCSSVRFEDTLEAFLNPNDPLYHGYLSIGKEISTADGILVNTWEDLEPKSLRALRDGKLLGGVAKAPVYTIGPLARTVGPVSENRVLEWLDMQASESVIYVSFGSGGTLSSKQMIELAWGLELSQQRFIWVVRPPLENDVSEQKMNATMLTEELKVSVRSKELPTERIVERQEIEMMVRKVMLDKERVGIKNKVKELKTSALKASSKGGSSYNSLSQFTQDCETRLQCLKVKAQGA